MPTISTKSVYFTHDSNALSDEKILKIRRKYGIEGYGIYFALLEKLSASNEYKLNLDCISDIAYDWRVDENKVGDIIKNFNLFQIEGNSFYSLSHRLKMQYKDDKAEKKRQAAQARLESLTPEQLAAQNKKAANARWDKQKKGKDMQASAGINASRMQAPAGIDALNKNKDINREKDNDEYKDQDKDLNLSVQDSSLTKRNNVKHFESSFESKSISKVEKSNPNQKNENEKTNLLESRQYFSAENIQNMVDDYLQSESKFFQGKNKNIVTNGYIEFFKEYSNTKVDLLRFEKVLYAYLISSFGMYEIEKPIQFNQYLETKNVVFSPYNIQDVINNLNNANKTEYLNAFNNIIDKVLGNENC